MVPPPPSPFVPPTASFNALLLALVENKRNEHSLALLESGHVLSWGDGEGGALGDGRTGGHWRAKPAVRSLFCATGIAMTLFVHCRMHYALADSAIW